jgi:hypothetical protein
VKQLPDSRQLFRAANLCRAQIRIAFWQKSDKNFPARMKKPLKPASDSKAVAGTGFELTQETTLESAGSLQSGAKSGARQATVGAERMPNSSFGDNFAVSSIDPVLALLIDRWPTLSADQQQKIMAILNNVIKDGP